MENETALKQERGVAAQVPVRNFNVRVEGTDFQVQVQSYTTTPFFKLDGQRSAWRQFNRDRYVDGSQKAFEKNSKK